MGRGEYVASPKPDLVMGTDNSPRGLVYYDQEPSRGVSSGIISRRSLQGGHDLVSFREFVILYQNYDNWSDFWIIPIPVCQYTKYGHENKHFVSCPVQIYENALFFVIVVCLEYSPHLCESHALDFCTISWNRSPPTFDKSVLQTFQTFKIVVLLAV